MSLPFRDSHTEFGSWSSELPLFQNSPGSHTFGEALEALIEAAKDGSIQRFRERHCRREIGPNRTVDMFWMRVCLLGPLPQARVSIGTGKQRHDQIYGHPLVTTGEDGRVQLEEIPTRFSGDLRWRREFGHTTILEIADLLNASKEQS